VTVRLALEDFLPPDHFARTGGAALVLGSGGAGCALSHQLGVRADRPNEIICTERSDDRLDHLRDLHARSGIAGVRYVRVAGPADTDALLAALPSSSLVANATGMGKDTPGSPLTDAARFPAEAVVWELNYRGELDFLHQARAQAEERSLQVDDGWLYFIHGWTAVIEEVFDIRFTASDIAELARIAGEIRAGGAAA